MTNDEVSGSIRAFHVYPGHPIVLAWHAMSVFSSAQAALARDSYGDGWSCLVGNSDIPGSGDAAHATDFLLRCIARGTMTLDEAIAHADNFWMRVTDGVYKSVRESGIECANKIKPRFLERANQWDWTFQEEPTPPGICETQKALMTVRNPETNFLQKVREERGITRPALALRSGLADMTIMRIENGNSCRSETKRRILRGLEMERTDIKLIWPDAPIPTRRKKR